MIAPPQGTDNAAAPDVDLTFKLHHRLARTLEARGIQSQEIAAFLEVHKNTVSTWLNGHATPSPATLKQWALFVNVPYMWLRYGPEGKPEETEKPTVTD